MSAEQAVGTPEAVEAEKPEPGSYELLQHHAKAAQAAYLAEQDESAEQASVAKAAALADKEAAKTEGKERGPDGKFKPAATKPKAELAKAEPTAAKPAPVAIAAGSLSELQELVNAGKIPEALKALGLDEKGLSGKQWEAFHKDTKKDRAAIERGKQEAANAYRQVEQIAANLESQYGRYRAAQQAYEAGDYDAAFQQAFGENLNAFQQKAIQRLATRDPEVARLRAELRAKEQREEQQRAQWQAQQAEQSLIQERQAYVDNLSRELRELDDPRIPRAAEGRKDFVQRVFDQQAKHLRGSGESARTISTREAADLALAELESEYASLQSLFGQGGAAKPAAKASGVRTGGPVPSRSVSPARPVTNLRQQEAAEAHRSEKLTGAELLAYHARKTRLALEREQGGGFTE